MKRSKLRVWAVMGIVSFFMVATLTGCQSTKGAEAAPVDATPVTSSGYTAGTYQTVGAGFMGEVQVETVFDETSIVSVTILSSSETPEVAGTALQTVPEAIVAAQTYDVDIVAGATFASNAIRDAVRLAMEQASN